ncbi:MAG: aspartate aminotransferase family protein [Pseudomonadota bacterium]
MKNYLMNVYTNRDPNILRGKGVYLYDDQGHKWLDFHAGIGVNVVGHCHPILTKTLINQAKKLWHCSNLHMIQGQKTLAQKLCHTGQFESAFFCNSGVEALEGMIKCARRYYAMHGQPHRWRIITLKGAFHGRSLATLSAAKNPKHLEGFGPMVEGFDQVAFANMNDLRMAIGDETAAILLEPIQGEGGICNVDIETMKALRQCADEYDLLLLLDEVQCGNGRTGKYWAYQWAEIKPDCLATAKGLGGGFPIGAVLANEKISTSMHAGSHGSTFGGNPLAMAVANDVLDIVNQSDFLNDVQTKGLYLQHGLQQLVKKWSDIYYQARGLGLMQGLVCCSSSKVMDGLKSQFILTVSAANNVLRLLPPLIIEKKHIDDLLKALDHVAYQLSNE